MKQCIYLKKYIKNLELFLRSNGKNPGRKIKEYSEDVTMGQIISDFKNFILKEDKNQPLETELDRLKEKRNHAVHDLVITHEGNLEKTNQQIRTYITSQDNKKQPVDFIQNEITKIFNKEALKTADIEAKIKERNI